MNVDMLELVYKKLLDLEKRMELYYSMLKIDNELSFILKGTYLFNSDIESVINGTY